VNKSEGEEIKELEGGKGSETSNLVESGRVVDGSITPTASATA
jgi:hypothetical protein